MTTDPLADIDLSASRSDAIAEALARLVGIDWDKEARWMRTATIELAPGEWPLLKIEWLDRDGDELRRTEVQHEDWAEFQYWSSEHRYRLVPEGEPTGPSPIFSRRA